MVLLPCTRYCCWLLVVGYYYLHLNLSHEEELTSTRELALVHIIINPSCCWGFLVWILDSYSLDEDRRVHSRFCCYRQIEDLKIFFAL